MLKIHCACPTHSLSGLVVLCGVWEDLEELFLKYMLIFLNFFFLGLNSNSV